MAKLDISICHIGICISFFDIGYIGIGQISAEILGYRQILVKMTVIGLNENIGFGGQYVAVNISVSELTKILVWRIYR